MTTQTDPNVPRNGSPSPSDSPSLERITAELIDGLGQGRAINRADLLARYPQHAGQLDSLIGAAELVAGLRKSGAGAGSFPPVAGAGEGEAEVGLPGQLGDFEILRELGRGGMGVVYEARQMSLNRRVALKILPFASVLDPRQLARFKNEALAAAALNHPHIVDVYGVGCERGVHYYAMRLIEGQSLAEALDELRQADATFRRVPAGRAEQGAHDYDAPTTDAARDPEVQAGVVGRSPSLTRRVSVACGETPRLAALSTDRVGRHEYYRTIARLGIDAAEALHHAHEQGVIHRDVKPSNLMLDDRGKLWVTDFGLAHVETQAGLTMSGELLGTLRYMSPEQASGQRLGIDHRSDVYSLGVTLYELLTLRCPFDSPQRSELLRQILFEEPRGLRKVRRDVPADLETIVLKCLEKSAEDRYGSAREVGEDLGRLVAEQPIRARPARQWERLSRWGRRNPVVAKLAVLLMLALTFGTAVSTFLAIQNRNALDLVRGQRNDLGTANTNERAARREAEESLVLAEDAVRKYLAETTRDEQLKQADFHDLRTRLLQSATPFYEQFARMRPGDAARELRRAEAHQQLAVISIETGQQELACGECERALAIFKGLTGDESARSEARCRHTFGSALRDLGRLEESRREFAAALEIRQRLARGAPDDGSLRLDLAKSHNGLGAVLGDLMEHSASRDEHARAVEILEPLVRAHGKVAEYREHLAQSYSGLGFALGDRGDHAGARDALVKAIERFESLLQERPGSLTYVQSLALAHQTLGVEYAIVGDNAEARIQFENAVPMLERLATTQPKAPQHQHVLLMTRGNLSAVLNRLGEAKLAREQLQRVIDSSATLITRFPKVPVFRENLIAARKNMAVFCRQSGDLEGARREHEDLVRIQEGLVAEFPENRHYEKELANRCVELGDISTECDDLLSAGARYAQAMAVAEQGLTAGHDFELETILGRARHLRGQMHQSAQELAEAREHFEHALVIRARLAAADVANIPRLRDEIQTQNSLGLVLRKTGDRQGAYTQFAAAISNSRRLAEMSPQNVDDQIHLAGILCNVANMQRDDELLEEALAGYASAQQTLQEVLRAHPDHPVAKQFLRNVRLGRAEALDSSGRHSEAAEKNDADDGQRTAD